MTAVSVIIPTFGRGEWFRAALDSALAQQLTDIEILIGDNGRDDTKRRMLADYDDPRIRYVQHETNLGPQGNWVELVRLARSPLVASLHDDDVWEPNFLSSLVPILEAEPQVQMAFCDYWLIDAAGRRLEAETDAVTRMNARDRLPAGVVAGGLDEMLRLVAVHNAPQPAYAAVFRRDAALIDYPDDISPLYDIWLSYSIARAGGQFAYVPERLTRYRQHPGTGTSKGFAVAEDRVFERMLAAHPDSPVADEIRRKWAWLRWGRAAVAMDQPDGRERSQAEFRAAARHLDGGRRLVASACGRVDIAWTGLRAVRRLRNRVRPSRTRSDQPRGAAVHPPS
ncbi:MAG: glycosyltransferase [Acidimicrobiales bacterium]|nr:glycosyltransferase [Acidimicrobiales bacterium]MCB9392318.1 glycosyltransferase [Acidimicrobiaceae bacterium]